MSSTRSLRVLVFALLFVALSVPAALAQVGTGQISGRVTDSSGAVLPGVDVTATQTSTGLTRSTVTSEAGLFTLPALPVGPYRVEVTLAGFRTFVQEGLTLQVNANLVVDPVMQLGELNETISVTARPSDIEVETRGVGVGTVVERERILELPLSGRQVNDLITLSGAAVQVDQSPSWGMATGVNISVAGGSRFGVAYMLDGATNTNRFDQTGMPTPFPDALQEFRVSTSTQEAGTGRASGASVNAVTRSGTNQFDGNLFWFGRDARFNARKADATRDDGLKRHQPGFSVGGPIIQNKLFFFTGYQSTLLEQRPSDTLSIVPTAAMLAGDWSAYNQCYRPNWRDTDFADGSVDPSRYSPAARALAARLPAAQNPCGEVRWGNPVERHDKQTVTRVDYQHSNQHSLFGRYMATLHDQDVQFREDNLLTASASAAGFHDRAHSAVLGHTWIISPTVLSSSRFAYNRITVEKLGARFFDPQDVGINMWTSVPEHFVLTVAGGFGIGSGPTALREMWQNQFQLGNDISIMRGAHQITFGGGWERANVLSLAHTRGVGGLSIQATQTGNAMADFLLGRVTENRQAMPTVISPTQDYVSLYAQDDWRMSDRITLNYGVRWDPYIPLEFRDNPHGGVRVYNFSIEGFKAGEKSQVFPTAPAGFTYPSQSNDGSGPADFEGRSAIPGRWNKFAPRVGVSWDPTGTGNTSVRAGYGLTYDQIELQAILNATAVSPWVGDLIHRNGTLDDPWAGLPGGNPFPFDWRTNPKFVPDSVFIPFSRDLDMTNVQTWNVALQQQLVNRWLASVSYIGSYSSNLWNTTAINPSLVLTPQSHPNLFTGPNTCVLEGVSYTPCNTTGNVNQRRELRLWAAASGNPERLADARLFSNLDEYRSDSTADYHGMLTSVRGNLYNVNLNANYTLSRCTTDRTNVGVSNPNQTFHKGRDRQVCAGDRTHLFNLTAVATAPQFSRPLVNAIASNWRVSGIYRYSSGAPHSVLAGTDRALTGLAGQVADQVSDDIIQDDSGKLGSQYLNRAAFAPPALGTYGNMDFNSVRGFPVWTLDAALSRIFDVIADHRIEFRVEAFNVLNAYRPADPSFQFTNANFGRVTGALDPRIMQFAVKYVF